MNESIPVKEIRTPTNPNPKGEFPQCPKDRILKSPDDLHRQEITYYEKVQNDPPDTIVSLFFVPCRNNHARSLTHHRRRYFLSNTKTTIIKNYEEVFLFLLLYLRYQTAIFLYVNGIAAIIITTR